MTRLLVVGADAAGMAAAHQALRTAQRRGGELQIIALEMTDHTSYSQCGIPYWVADDVVSADALVARTPEQHRRAGIDLRLRQQVVGLDLDRRQARVRDLGDPAGAGGEYVLDFDEVLLATGAAPVIPDWARVGDGLLPRVHPMKTLDDGRLWRRLVDDRPNRALVVGGGYIGVEAAESLARRHIPTTLLTRREPMAASLVPEQTAAVRAGLEAIGVEVVSGAEIVDGAAAGSDDAGSIVLTAADGRTFSGDAVVLALGVSPRTELAVDAGLPGAPESQQWARGALVPDERQRLADGVWAAGDCCAVRDLLVGEPVYLPLGTHANKAGRVAGTNLGGGQASFPGAVGTAITRAGDVEVARTGLHLEWARLLGYDPITAELDATTASGYMPEAEPMHLWAVADRGGRLLGVQITGGRGAGKRIDVVAAALSVAMSCEQFAYLDLSYAPPFSSAWDPVQIVVRKLAETA